MNFIPYKDIPTSVVTLINEVVEKDEGGWILNPPDPNDQDGGWTFGGITSSLYNKYYTKEGQQTIVRSTLERILLKGEEGEQFMMQDCIVIYFNEFCVPLAHLYPHSSLNIQIPEIEAMQLSCFINVGEKAFLKILKAAQPIDASDYKQKFLEAWQSFYIHLVVENAKAWKEYADAVLPIIHDSVVFESVEKMHEIIKMKPATLRAIYLVGWLNRVARYA